LAKIGESKKDFFPYTEIQRKWETDLKVVSTVQKGVEKNTKKKLSNVLLKAIKTDK